MLTHLFTVLFVFIGFIPGFQLEVKSPILEISETVQCNFGYMIDPSVGQITNKAIKMETEPKYSDSFRNYLGLIASMYFLYPGSFGHP